jgi:hypothetical protein
MRSIDVNIALDPATCRNRLLARNGLNTPSRYRVTAAHGLRIHTPAGPRNGLPCQVQIRSSDEAGTASTVTATVERQLTGTGVAIVFLFVSFLGTGVLAALSKHMKIGPLWVVPLLAVGVLIVAAAWRRDQALEVPAEYINLLEGLADAKQEHRTNSDSNEIDIQPPASAAARAVVVKTSKQLADIAESLEKSELRKWTAFQWGPIGYRVNLRRDGDVLVGTIRARYEASKRLNGHVIAIRVEESNGSSIVTLTPRVVPNLLKFPGAALAGAVCAGYLMRSTHGLAYIFVPVVLGGTFGTDLFRAPWAVPRGYVDFVTDKVLANGQPVRSGRRS